MAINFWISIPVLDFFGQSKSLIEKYNVSVFVEMKRNEQGAAKTYYVSFDSCNIDGFAANFSAPDYYNFYFSCYPRLEMQNMLEMQGYFYNEEVSPYTIEGRGGYETAKTREQIHLRQILKEPDKNIKAFYFALQRKLKAIPDIQVQRKGAVNLYYLHTEKIMIPPHPHSRKITGS